MLVLWMPVRAASFWREIEHIPRRPNKIDVAHLTLSLPLIPFLRPISATLLCGSWFGVKPQGGWFSCFLPQFALKILNCDRFYDLTA